MKVRSVDHFPAEQTDDLAILVRAGDVRAGRRVTTPWIAAPFGLVALALHDTIFSRRSNFGTKRTATQSDGDVSDAAL